VNVQQKDVYVTKYLFTKGIEKRLVWDHGSFLNDVKDNWYTYQPKECHDTFEEAVICAEKMKAKKLDSLEKQLKKVSSMEFKQEA